jgi:hypothetical protein
MTHEFDQLTVWLTKALLRIPTSSSYLEVISKLSQKRELSTLIGGALGNSQILDAIAARSYQHNNGFEKIVLVASKTPQYKLRLHVWWPNASIEPTETNIHSHRWDFSSSVLVGALTCEEFVVSNEESSPYHHLVYSPVVNNKYSIQSVGVTYLSCARRDVLRRGDIYYLAFNRLHSVNADRTKLAATLFLQGPDLVTTTDVFTTQNKKKTAKIHVQPIAPSALSDKLVNLASELNL